MQAQTLEISSSLVPFPQHDPLVHKRVFRSLVFGRVWEYSRVTHALASFSFTPTSFDIISTLVALHPNLDGSFSLILEDYKPDENFEFSSDYFNLTF